MNKQFEGNGPAAFGRGIGRLRGIAFAVGRYARLLAPRREGVEIALVEIRVDVCEFADRLVERVA